MFDLAIVIPAYKEKYFEKTLCSLAKQTRKDFTVYVGDDFSPDDLKSICEKFKNKLNINYTRFSNNIGAKNLVDQWKRCVKLINNENWIWLFSDDDFIDTTCVENFNAEIQRHDNPLDIYRFNTVVVDNNDKPIYYTPISPSFENSEEMAYNLLIGKRGNSMADHIFSKKIYDRTGGFVYTEYAQGADWAMSILFSKDKGIGVIPNSNFYWRYGGLNISSTVGKVKSKMLNGHIQFLFWLTDHFQYLKYSESKISYSKIICAARENLKTVLIMHYKGFRLNSIYKLTRLMHDKMNLSYREIFKDLFVVFKCTNKYVAFFSNLKKRLGII